MEGAYRGAEAIVYIRDGMIVKERLSKKYRNRLIDKKITSRRTKTEANLLRKLEGIRGIPKLHGIQKNVIRIENIEGKPLSEHNITNADRNRIAMRISRLLLQIHKKGIVHGDVTPRNIIISEKNDIWVIDFGLSSTSSRIEDKASDLWMTKETFMSQEGLSERIMHNYIRMLDDDEKRMFEERLEKMSRRGRHRSRQ